MDETTKKATNRSLPSLKKRSEFLALRQAPRFSCPAFILQGHLTLGEGPLEVGLTVTKKTGNAVERNRIKRRLRTAISQACSGFEEKAEGSHGLLGGKVVIVARRTVLSEPHGLLVANLTKGIDRLLAKGKKAVSRNKSER